MEGGSETGDVFALAAWLHGTNMQYDIFPGMVWEHYPKGGGGEYKASTLLISSVALASDGVKVSARLRSRRGAHGGGASILDAISSYRGSELDFKR